jgi:hypothetical protein
MVVMPFHRLHVSFWEVLSCFAVLHGGFELETSKGHWCGVGIAHIHPSKATFNPFLSTFWELCLNANLSTLLFKEFLSVCAQVLTDSKSIQIYLILRIFISL